MRTHFPGKRLTTLCAVLSLALTASVAAHHSFSAIYDIKNVVKVKGTVTRLEWANPHVHFVVDVKKADGTVTQWIFELHSVNDMMRNGWSRNSLKVGDVVTVEGAHERGNSNRAFAYYAQFADGRRVFMDKEESKAETTK